MAIDRICSLTKQRPPINTRGLLSGDGTVVPADGTDGWQTGAIFQHTDGGGGTSLYVNEGSVTDSDFNAIDAGAIDVSLDVGVFASLLPGDGIAISSTDTSAVAIYGDDAGLSIASNVYNLRTRLLLTTSQAGSSIRALMAQLKLADGVNVGTGIYTASQGYVELAGDTTVQAFATFTCFDASLEIGAGNTLTVAADGEAAGLRVETTGTGTISATGICAGILVDKATGAADWPLGVCIKNTTDGLTITGAANRAVNIQTSGVFVMGVQGTGIDLTTTYPFAMEVQCEANANITEGDTGSSAGFYTRYAIIAAQTTSCNHIGVFAKLRVKANLGIGNHVGVYGLVEKDAGTTSGNAATLTAGGLFALDISVPNITTGHLNGVCIDSSVAAGGTMNATMSGLRIKKSGANRAWVTGITLEDSATTTGIKIGACATAINVAGLATTRVLQYATVTEVDEPGAGHLIQYGATAEAPIVWTPTATASGLQMYITSASEGLSGFGIAGVRVKITLTGATKITANAGNFWTKIDCTNYSGDYLGGHPVGVQGIIELAGDERSAAGGYAVMAGVVGEVRPITCTTTNLGTEGKICGLHAKVFAVATEVSGTGDIVGLFVQPLGTGASDIGILVQPHTSASLTVGLEFDSRLGAIATGISISTCTTRAIDIVTTTAATGLTDISLVSTYTGTAHWESHQGAQFTITYTPSTGTGSCWMQALGGTINVNGIIDDQTYFKAIGATLNFAASADYNASNSIACALTASITSESGADIQDGNIAILHLNCASQYQDLTDTADAVCTFIFADNDSQHATGGMDSVICLHTWDTPYLLDVPVGYTDGIMDLTATAGTLCVGHLKIRFQGNDAYINVFSDNS